MKALADDKVATSGFYTNLALYIAAWDRAGDSKSSIAALNTFFWSTLSDNMAVVVEDGGDLDPYITMIVELGADGRAQSLSSLNLLVFKLWSLLTDKLKAQVQTESVLLYLSQVLAQYKVKSIAPLHKRIFPGENGEELFLTTLVLPLLAKEDLIP